MKRVTFVLAGIVMIITFVLVSQKSFEDKTLNYVKVDAKKHHLKTIYD